MLIRKFEAGFYKTTQVFLSNSRIFKATKSFWTVILWLSEQLLRDLLGASEYKYKADLWFQGRFIVYRGDL